MNVLKIFLASGLAFFIGILITPPLTGFLYKHKMWKKTSVKKTTDGYEASISSKLHNDEERKTPRMGGVVIWGSTAVTALILRLLPIFVSETATFNIISRNQTWLPLFTLLAGGLFGLIDDYFVCQEKENSVFGGGLSPRTRLLFVGLLGAIGAWWFYVKLGMTSITIPFSGNFYIGLFFIPTFILFFIGIYSGGIIDGVDGLSGGVFAAMYTAYAVIAFVNGQYDLAAYTAVVVGGLLAFLWFNIPPARFFNSETGTMALTTSIVVVAFLTKAVIPLLIIALPLILTSASSTIQILSKKFRGGKRVFLVAPLHNHFQALGWPSYKVTMRYWIISVVCAIIGTVVALL